MTHALSAEEDSEAADRRARIQSSENQYGRKTWSQMEVRAVVRYESARGTSILDIHRILQSAYGEDVMSVNGSALLVKKGDVADVDVDGRPDRSSSSSLCLPTSPTRPLIAHNSTHFHL
ncbi:hypothetical protein AVEN_262139-1 [Araneus ventricosus]|uniref:Mos1 transposase HTH domain-containing protein n=1 Tax=Araneus ventricosus TaxID=182803 RepID=A0A4Y2PLT9_ARAVE|nr:hypothetical protein AVEN_262139-1 [Araneus ventricosus]